MPITKFENFLSEECFTHALKYATTMDRCEENVYHLNNFWQEEITRDSFPVMVNKLRRDCNLYEKIKYEALEKLPQFKNIDYNCVIQFYFWTRFSYIPWHSDPGKNAGLTIYLNEHWLPHYGGYFLYQADDTKDFLKNDADVRAIIPKRNRAVLQENETWHATTPVSYDGRMRYTIQIWFQ